MSLLAIDTLCVRYDAIEAVKGISLTVGEGELVALIGANGAGKTTTLNCLAGLLKPAAGTLRYNGRDLAAIPMHERIRHGLVLVPEGRGIFSRLTVAENLQMGAYVRDDKAGIAADLEQAYAQFPRLAERRAQLAGTLSGGEQQMLAIGRAMMARPSLLLLDEPSLGIAPKLVQQIFEAIKTIAAAGVTILVVEQNTRIALQTSKRAYVLRTGEIALEGASEELAKNEEIRAAYLGG